MANGALAQDFDRYFSLSWEYNAPLANTSDWIGNASATGARLTYKKMINDRFAAGVDFTWNVFDEYEPTQTFENGSGAITTDYFKYTYGYGFAASGQYFLPFSTTKVMPYVGLGLGAALNRYTLYYNVYSEGDDSWGFLARPEIGVMFPFGGKVGAQIGVRYDFSTADSEYFELDKPSNLAVNVGLVLMSY